jgi:hypothetical protein
LWYLQVCWHSPNLRVSVAAAVAAAGELSSILSVGAFAVE